jgi:hypothetical protein
MVVHLVVDNLEISFDHADHEVTMYLLYGYKLLRSMRDKMRDYMAQAPGSNNC